MDSLPISCKSLEYYFHVDGKQLQQQYRDHLSDFKYWAQRDHSEDWVLFEHNIGPYLSIDETALSNGELYTILTNKEAKGKKGCLIAIIKGTIAKDISSILKKISKEKRELVKEITLDMAASMNKIVSTCFPKATRVIDRFHVQKLANEAVQNLRITHRREAIDEESVAIKKAKAEKEKYIAPTFENGDTKKQLLARSRYLLFKSPHKWSESQKSRAKILFENFPDIKKAHDLTCGLNRIFSKTTEKAVAYTKLAQWYKDVEEAKFKSFNVIANTIYTHYQGILNYFDRRSTNASAESFNAKIKAFRRVFRGVRDIPFFLFRLTNIYA